MQQATIYFKQIREK